jgi:hypothetical protein
MKLEGGCHCGAVRFAITVEARPEVLSCNCSICSRIGYLHLIVPHDQFTLLNGRDNLQSYRFGSETAEHLFCRTCGIKSFYQPRSHPDCWSVHLACLDSPDSLDPVIRDFDGRNWEQARSAL